MATIPVNKPFLAIKQSCIMIEQGALAIFGPENFLNFGVVQSVCDHKEIPLIQTVWSRKNEKTRGSTVINTFPSDETLSMMYLDFIKTFNWKKFTVLYEDDDSFTRILGILKLTLDNSYTIYVKKLDQYRTGVYRTILQEVADQDINNFIIDCKIDSLQQVLIQCQQIGLMNRKYNYFILNLDMHILDMTIFQYSKTNITGVRFINKNDEAKKELCVEQYEDYFYSECFFRNSYALTIDGMSLLYNIIKETKNSSIFNTKKISCSNKESWEYGQSFVNLMKASTIEGMTGLIKFDNEGYRSDLILEVVELQEKGITTIGTWAPSEGFKLERLQVPMSKEEMGSMVGKNFTIQTTLTKPFGYLTESPYPLQGNARYEGFAIDLIRALSEIEHFNYTFVLRDDKDNGNKNSITGQWSGMLGEIINGTTDMAITDLTINSQRVEDVDFSLPFMNLGIAILFQKPKEAPPNFFSFAEPLAGSTWACIIATYIGIAVSLYILGRICPSEWVNPYPCIQDPEFLENQFTLGNCFWFTTGAMMQQGSELAPRATATRIVAGMWWFLILIIIASYTASLAAVLATENPQKLFTDVKSLVENAELKKIRYGAKANGTTYNFFKNSKKPVYQKVFEHMRIHPEDMVKNNDEGVKLALTEQYALFMEDTTLSYETQRHCNLEMYGDLLDNKGYGIALKKGSPYRSRLSSAILKLKADGVIDSLKRKWWEEKRGGGRCVSIASPDATPLSFKHVEGVFMVTIQGLIFGFAAIILERFIHIFRVSRKIKTPFMHIFKFEMKEYLRFKDTIPTFKQDQN